MCFVKAPPRCEGTVKGWVQLREVSLVPPLAGAGPRGRSVASPLDCRTMVMGAGGRMRWWKRGRAGAGDRRSNSVEEVCAALQDDEVPVRREAVRKLRRLGDPRAVGPLLDALDREVRSATLEASAADIIDALAEFGGPEAEERLVGLLRIEEFWHEIDVDTPDEPPFVAAVVWVTPALLDMGGAELMLRGLLETLGDRRQELRCRAARELENIAWRSASGNGLTAYDDEELTDAERDLLVSSLCSALLAEDDAQVRNYLAGALGDLGDKRAVEPLRQALSSDESISQALREALAKLDGR
ncbi:HEAT repeat domain-containing protein [Streptomyces sp. NPDC051217]|uniref:HEAT repeat domain-containing protein n=1 Tax=Streptomyces sp. NPDC051217 TaxID=3365644 RepID=UPI0037B3C912